MTGAKQIDADAAEWRIVPGFPHYEVSEHGTVRRRLDGGSPIAHAGRVLRPYANSRYLRVCLHDGAGKRKWESVHRLVAFAFHGAQPSPGHQVAHNDGNPHNNSADNVRWATASENSADKRAHGTMLAGERHGGARFTASQVEAIREAAGLGLPHRVIAKIAGTSQSHITRIVRGQSWGVHQ